MSDERFICIDIGYGDDWYITDDGKRLSEMEIVDLLNSLSNTVSELREENKRLKRENEALESNVKWFAHQLKNPTPYFLETLETIKGEDRRNCYEHRIFNNRKRVRQSYYAP